MTGIDGFRVSEADAQRVLDAIAEEFPPDREIKGWTMRSARCAVELQVAADRRTGRTPSEWLLRYLDRMAAFQEDTNS